MLVTAAQLAAIFPTGKALDAWAPAISDAWDRFRFQTENAQAGYLGICGNETGGLTHVARENMNYSPDRAAQIFTKARNNPDYCDDRCSHGPEAFANWIYAGVLGNGDEASGDGWRFRGGGIIQLTGRANYRACGQALGIDLEADPDALTADKGVSAAAAAWFMAVYRSQILPLLDSDSEADFVAGAKLVGWTDAAATQRRLDYRRKALTALGDTAPHEDTHPPPVTGPRVMRKGMKGDDVRQAQRRLNEWHLATFFAALVLEDGDFGEKTEEAVKFYQKLNHLEADGIIGPKTAKSLGTV